jgi:hypothetical protein
MKHLTRPLLASLIAFLSVSLHAEVKSTAHDQTQVWITVYNGGRALVKDYRSLNLPDNTQSIALMDVAEKIMPQTVAIDGLDVLEQNYDFDLLSPQSLINKNIGRKLRIARRSSDTGETLEWRTGTILSTQGGVILKMDDGTMELLDSASNYHLVFEEIPDSLRISPTLSLRLAQKTAGVKDIQLTYLTTGLSWQSDYVLQLDDNEKTAVLHSWITLNNQSGIAYKNPRLQLLAGDVNLQHNARPEKMADTMRLKAMSAPMIREQALQGYHLYTVAHQTSINNRQSKQIKLFSASHIPVQKKLQDRAYIDAYNIDPITSKPEQFLVFDNRKPALGIPLPKGVIRVYGKDNSGQNQFLGEDRIDHSAVNDKLKINIGKSFDITVERQTVDFKQISKKQRIYQRRIRINNGSKKTQIIDLSEIMPSQKWTIRKSSKNYQKTSARSAEFSINLPAMEKTVIEYEVLVTYP